MNQFDENKDIEKLLRDTAEQINPNGMFVKELEEDLKKAHKPHRSFSIASLHGLMPTFARAVALFIFAALLIWMIQSLQKTQPRIGNGEMTVTPQVMGTPTIIQGTNNSEGIDFRGGKLFLAQPLPESPSTANVYKLNKDQPATIEQARALADRFGVQGEIYTTNGRMPDTTEYAISDGKQWLSVSTNNYFFYTSDMVKNSRGFSGTPNDNAEAIIREFLDQRGFNFPYKVTSSGLYGGYLVQPLAADGIPMQYEYFASPVMHITLDENGEVLSLDASLINYDQTPLGTYGIISAEEAMQILLDDSSTTRKIESMHSSSGTPPQTWYREYADGEPAALYGTLTSSKAVDPSKPALLLIDNIPAIGNTSGMESLDMYTYVEATGKFVTEGNVRKFVVDTWQEDNSLGYFLGSLHREGDQILLTVEGEGGATYPLIDPPADVPLDTPADTSSLSVNGTIVDGKLDWTFIQYFADVSQMGGGGGGGGMGFYQLNLSGTPIPMPTPTQIPTPQIDPNAQTYVVKEGDTLSMIAEIYNISPQDLMRANGLSTETIFIGQTLVIPSALQPIQLDGVRGMLIVNVFTREDGSERVEYGFVANQPVSPEIYYMTLQGDNLEELKQYNNRPAKIWGTTGKVNEFGALNVNMDRYELLFPDLQFQILKGVEESIQIDGKDVALFTTEDGKQYIEYLSNCYDVASADNIAGNAAGETMLLEALAVPDLSFGGYPGICTFSKAYGFNPKNGNTIELPITSDKPNVIPEMPAYSGDYTPPDLTIDKVELIYFTSNPNYQVNDPTASERSQYIQPVWHFHGKYTSGEEVDIMIQALKPEFLAPELVPYIQGG